MRAVPRKRVNGLETGVTGKGRNITPLPVVPNLSKKVLVEWAWTSELAHPGSVNRNAQTSHLVRVHEHAGPKILKKARSHTLAMHPIGVKLHHKVSPEISKGTSSDEAL